jgi:hypothetical protein
VTGENLCKATWEESFGAKTMRRAVAFRESVKLLGAGWFEQPRCRFKYPRGPRSMGLFRRLVSEALPKIVLDGGGPNLKRKMGTRFAHLHLLLFDHPSGVPATASLSRHRPAFQGRVSRPNVRTRGCPVSCVACGRLFSSRPFGSIRRPPTVRDRSVTGNRPADGPMANDTLGRSHRSGRR